MISPRSETRHGFNQTFKFSSVQSCVCATSFLHRIRAKKATPRSESPLNSNLFFFGWSLWVEQFFVVQISLHCGDRNHFGFVWIVWVSKQPTDWCSVVLPAQALYTGLLSQKMSLASLWKSLRSSQQNWLCASFELDTKEQWIHGHRWKKPCAEQTLLWTTSCVWQTYSKHSKTDSKKRPRMQESETMKISRRAQKQSDSETDSSLHLESCLLQGPEILLHMYVRTKFQSTDTPCKAKWETELWIQQTSPNLWKFGKTDTCIRKEAPSKDIESSNNLLCDFPVSVLPAQNSVSELGCFSRTGILSTTVVPLNSTETADSFELCSFQRKPFQYCRSTPKRDNKTFLEEGLNFLHSNTGPNYAGTTAYWIFSRAGAVLTRSAEATDGRWDTAGFPIPVTY